MHRVLFDSDLLFLDFAFFCPESQARLKRCASLPIPVTPPDSESDPPLPSAQHAAAPSRAGSGCPLCPAQPATASEAGVSQHPALTDSRVLLGPI